MDDVILHARGIVCRDGGGNAHCGAVHFDIEVLLSTHGYRSVETLSAAIVQPAIHQNGRNGLTLTGVSPSCPAEGCAPNTLYRSGTAFGPAP